MKFTISRNDILDVMANVQGLTGRKSSLAITATVLIQVEADRIRVSATDLETGFEGFYPAQVELEGLISLNARKLFEIVRDFPSENINFIKGENRWVDIGDDNVQYHIAGMDPESFPQNPVFEDIELFNIDSSHFKKMIDKTVGIIGPPDDKRAHILGVYLNKIDGNDRNELRMVSTDIGRLAKVDYTYGKNVQLPFKDGILIPKKGLMEVSKFLKADGIVKIGVSDNHLVLQKERESFLIRLLEGDFPNYEKAITKDPQYDMILDKQSFLRTLKRMSILAIDKYPAVLFTFNNGNLNIRSTSTEFGDSKEDMSVEYNREPIEVAYNPRYLIETLNVIEGEKVVINIRGKDNPCLIEEIEDKSYLAAIMAMKV